MTAPASPVELPQLPELPNAAYGVYDDYYTGIELEEPAERWHEMQLYSAEQMRAYGQQCYEAGVRAAEAKAATGGTLFVKTDERPGCN